VALSMCLRSWVLLAASGDLLHGTLLLNQAWWSQISNVDLLVASVDLLPLQ